MPATTIWDQILTLIEGKVGQHSFSTWFKPTALKTDLGRALGSVDAGVYAFCLVQAFLTACVLACFPLWGASLVASRRSTVSCFSSPRC